MNLTIPDLSLVMLIGASGSGKSTFARRHFKATEVLSSDVCRGLVSDDENDQSATEDAFDVLHSIAAKRLAGGRLTVVDATNVQPESRRPLVELARRYHCLPVAVVFNLPEQLCRERNATRPDRDFGPQVIRRQTQQLRRSLKGLQREGFRSVYVLSSPEQVEAATIERQPLFNDLKHEHGPFDIIGDVHGCYDELVDLLGALGYIGFSHPEGRKAVFLGDLVDRGPKTPDVLRLVMAMVGAGTALCVPGNHESKLLRKLQGRNVQVTHGLAESLAQLDEQPPAFREEVARFLDGLVSHYVLDDGKVVVAHAGMKAEMQGRGSQRVRDFALYGETTGETDEFGLPVRYNWAAEYRGRARVAYGHTPTPEPEWLNGTINIDTGCVFGGRLTALRYPELELVSVPARRTYYQPARPLVAEQPPAALSAQQEHDDVLDIDDVLGRRIVATRLMGNLTIREENAIAALEVMSRFAVDPKWLIYLPPTMSPPATSNLPGLLEHPAEAFAYYLAEGVPRVICEEKHMGSRAVVVLCRDAEAARRRFGVHDDATGVISTRTGRPFFTDAAMEVGLLNSLRMAMDAAGLWHELESDWVCLDCELMPWSLKAEELLRGQYAAVGAAARVALGEAVSALEAAAARGGEVGTLPAEYGARQEAVERYVAAYRRYCWPVESLADLRLAPFHVLASEGAVHVNKDHRWHMDMVSRLVGAGTAQVGATPASPGQGTDWIEVDVTDSESVETGVQWWTDLTERGGEGMVMKPLEFVAKGRRGLVQPGVKVRGREYLRIIYGPEYTAPGNLERLRQRGLGLKRSLAAREFALGVEGLERFVRREPFRRVHEC
ncbi:MAG: polynucleotide kinase-phosphatase, partial [Dehalococcoidia bacterium]